MQLQFKFTPNLMYSKMWPNQHTQCHIRRSHIYIIFLLHLLHICCSIICSRSHSLMHMLYFFLGTSNSWVSTTRMSMVMGSKTQVWVSLWIQKKINRYGYGWVITHQVQTQCDLYITLSVQLTVSQYIPNILFFETNFK